MTNEELARIQGSTVQEIIETLENQLDSTIKIRNSFSDQLRKIQSIRNGNFDLYFASPAGTVEEGIYSEMDDRYCDLIRGLEQHIWSLDLTIKNTKDRLASWRA